MRISVCSEHYRLVVDNWEVNDIRREMLGEAVLVEWWKQRDVWDREWDRSDSGSRWLLFSHITWEYPIEKVTDL